jgi:hypothetical protein
MMNGFDFSQQTVMLGSRDPGATARPVTIVRE